MLYPLLAMIFGLSLYFGGLLLTRIKAEVLNREKHTRWIKEMIRKDEK